MSAVDASRSETPAFGIRGVVEGFYGTPWTHADRLEMIRFIGARGMNRFVYSPKDDPFLRREWAEPYGPEALADLAELVSAGAAVGVRPRRAIEALDDAPDAERRRARLRSVDVAHFRCSRSALLIASPVSMLLLA